MPAPTLTALAQAPEEKVLDAIEATLADDPVIGAGGTAPVTFRFTGRTPAEQAQADVDSTTLPLVTVRDGEVPLDREFQNSFKATATFYFDCVHLGLNPRDTYRLTAAVMWALEPYADAAVPGSVARRDLVIARFAAAGAFPVRFRRGNSQGLDLGESKFARQTTLALEIRLFHGRR